MSAGALPVLAPISTPDRTILAGIAFGLLAVLMWGSYLAYARVGVSSGLGPADFIVLRYVTSGLVLLPFILRHGVNDLGGVGWGRGAILALLAGPLFIVLGVAGFMFAPLAVGAVVQPAAVTLFSLPAAWLVLNSRPTRNQVIAVIIVLAGLALMLSASNADTGASLIGAGFFASAGALWALFTVLLKRWQVGAVQATAAVSVISALVAGPVYFLATGGVNLLTLELPTLVTQIVVQGLFAGVFAVVAFGRAVILLGPGRAVLFTALVPGAALIIGVPVTGEIPVLAQILGAVIVIVGLVVSIRPGRRA